MALECAKDSVKQDLVQTDYKVEKNLIPGIRNTYSRGTR